MDELMKKLDAILDKYGITENRDAIKEDIYWQVMGEAYNLGYEDGNDPKRFWDN